MFDAYFWILLKFSKSHQLYSSAFTLKGIRRSTLIKINNIHNKVIEEFRRVSDIKKKQSFYDFGK